MVTLSPLGVGQNHQPHFTAYVSGHHIMVILTQFLLISPKLSPFGPLPRIISPELSALTFEFHPGRNFNLDIFLVKIFFPRCQRLKEMSRICDNMTHGARGNSRPLRCSGANTNCSKHNELLTTI